MATVNFSVPDEVKSAFDETFSGQNKSAVVADLMRRAVQEAQRQKRREELFRQLSGRRRQRRSASEAQRRAARSTGRP